MQINKPLIEKNDLMARRVIWSLSAIVLVSVLILSRVSIKVDWGFDVHIFAFINACLNTCVSLLLLLGYWAIRNKKIILHRNVMLAAIVLSAMFLLSYIGHHLFAEETKFRGTGLIRPIYYFLLITHILLAALILPFILYTAYRGMTNEYYKHKKLARITWPLWLYTSITGVIIYFLISPYYH